MPLISLDPDAIVKQYKVHILIFLLALFTAVTVAHPSIFVTDEWITINQLAQIQEGHQVILNEGKYGSGENGTASGYFIHKKNYLAYPLFLPVFSLPALWIVNSLDRFLIFAVIYFWTFLLIAIALFMNAYFPEYTNFRKFRWTSGLIIAAFILFFANLIFNRPFSVIGEEAFPEVMAVVLTNIFLFTLIAVMIFEINQSVFRDRFYSIFGTMVCVSCSSYLFWSNYCKDHILVAFLFVLITMLVVKYLTEDRLHYLYGAFIIAGLLAWARPELALFVFAFMCLFVVYIFLINLERFRPLVNALPLFAAPFFTLVGAIPFFINNYLFTGNIFLPAWILWDRSSESASAASGAAAVQQATPDTFGSLTRLFFSTSNFQPATFVTDLYGVLFNPQSGSLGIFPVVPLFLIALLLIPVLWILGKWQVSSEEKNLLAAMSILALGVFFAYARGISGMNASVGIVPDMRYLSPIYLPLNIIGLLVIRKLPFASETPLFMIKRMLSSWLILIPVTIFMIMVLYPGPESYEDLFPPLNILTVLAVYLLIMLSLVSILGTITFSPPKTWSGTVLAMTCAVPFIWQVDASFLVRLFGSGLGGYSFIVPVIRGVLLLHFI